MTKRKSALSALNPAKRQNVSSSSSETDVVVEDTREESFVSLDGGDQEHEVSTFSFSPSVTKVVRDEARGRSRVFHGMKFKESIVLRGAYVVTVWSGAIHINGALINSSSPAEIPVYAPASHSLPQIEAAAGSPELRASADEDVQEVLKQLEGAAAIVEVAAMPRKAENSLATMPSFGKLSSPNIVPFVRHLWATEPDTCSFNRFYATASAVTVSRAAVLPGVHGVWAETCDDIRRHKKSVTMVVGSQATGKSTFCKYLAVWMATKRSGAQVAFVDLDPGQTEFTAPGEVSLTVIGGKAGDVSPFSLLGPSYTHLVRPRLARYVGYNSPKEDTRGYIEACRTVVEAARALNIPVVINTCGWVRAAGHDLLSQIMQHVRPTDVVFTRDPGVDADQARLAENVSARSHVLEDEGSEAPRFTGADLRILQTVAYLHAGNFAAHLSELAPLQVPLDSVTFGILDSEGVDPVDVSLALNGTMVGVLAVDAAVAEQAEVTPDGLRYIAECELPTAECLGQAVVQSLSGTVQLHTPLGAAALNAVAADRAIVLVRGRVPLPVYELWDSRKTQKQPYVSFEVSEGAGSAAWQSRRGIKRR